MQPRHPIAVPTPRDLDALVARVLGQRPRSDRRAVLVGVSGIDGSGKGHIAALLADGVRVTGRRAAVVGIDEWHTPAWTWRGAAEPGVAFYERGLRLDECFERVVRPLARDGSVRAEADAILPDGRAWRATHSHGPADIVIIEGIFIFRRSLRPEFDLAVWIECSEATALARAIARNQEGLPKEAIRRDYAGVYVPAQRHHAAIDRARDAADLLVQNDASRTADA